MTVGELRYMITADTGGFDRAAGRTQRTARALDGLRAMVRVGTEGVRNTLRQMAGVRQAAEDVDDQDATVEVSTRGARTATRNLGDMGTIARLGTIQLGRFSAALVGVVAILPTLATLATTAAAGLAALSGVAAVAGAGIGAFAVSAVGNLNKVTDAMDELTKVREDLQEARREGDQEAINEALEERARILDDLNPAQEQLLRSIQDAKQAYEDFLDTTATPVSNALTDWIDLAAPALDMIKPLVDETAEALGGLAGVAEDMMTSDFWQDFVDLLAENVGPAFEEFGRIARPLFRALGELLEIFLPYGQDFLDWLSDTAERFAQWAESPEGQRMVEGFMDTAADIGPDVAAAFADIAGGVASLMGAFSEDGISQLQIVSGFFEWLSEGDNAEKARDGLYGIAAGLGAVAAALTAMKVAKLGRLQLSLLAIVAVAGIVGFWFDEISDWALGVGDTLIWVFTEKIPQGWNTFKNFFLQTVPDFVDWLTSEFKDLGKDIIAGLLTGILVAMADIDQWLRKNVWVPIRDAVLGLFGIGSPSKKFQWFGNQMILGLVEGLGQGGWDSMIDKIFGGASDKAAQALGWLVSKGQVAMSALADAGSWVWEKLGGLGGALGDLFGGGGAGGGVQRWAGLVSSVLGMLGQPQDLVDDVLQRMQQESGGNPRAINRWDINAMRGDPSRGLMQTIGSTFRAYAGQFEDRGIYDPLANIYAALRYSMDRYGSIAAAMHQPGGYATGAWRIGEDQVATVHRGEMVLPQKLAEQVRGALSGGDGASTPPIDVNVYLDGEPVHRIAQVEISRHQRAQNLARRGGTGAR